MEIQGNRASRKNKSLNRKKAKSSRKRATLRSRTSKIESEKLSPPTPRQTEVHTSTLRQAVPRHLSPLTTQKPSPNPNKQPLPSIEGVFYPCHSTEPLNQEESARLSATLCQPITLLHPIDRKEVGCIDRVEFLSALARALKEQTGHDIEVELTGGAVKFIKDPQCPLNDIDITVSLHPDTPLEMNWLNSIIQAL